MSEINYVSKLKNVKLGIVGGETKYHNYILNKDLDNLLESITTKQDNIVGTVTLENSRVGLSISAVVEANGKIKNYGGNLIDASNCISISITDGINKYRNCYIFGLNGIHHTTSINENVVKELIPYDEKCLDLLKESNPKQKIKEYYMKKR